MGNHAVEHQPHVVACVALIFLLLGLPHLGVGQRRHLADEGGVTGASCDGASCEIIVETQGRVHVSYVRIDSTRRIKAMI